MRRLLLLAGLTIAAAAALTAPVACGDDEEPTPSTQGVASVTTRIDMSDGRSFECLMTVPAAWAGKYDVREGEGLSSFVYTAGGDAEHPLFGVSALTEDEWQSAQEEPGHGVLIREQEGAALVHVVTLDNPYTGAEGDEFQALSAQVPEIIRSLECSGPGLR